LVFSFALDVFLILVVQAPDSLILKQQRRKLKQTAPPALMDQE
jgi:hypothetical protein